MKKILEFLMFKRMASPVLIQLLFWAGVGSSLYGAYVLYNLENWAWPFPLVLGPILVRVIFERAIIAFRSYDRLCDIHAELQKKNFDIGKRTDQKRTS